MAKPSSYWDKRALRRLTEAEKQGETYSKRIQKIYDQAHKNIQRDIENIYANYSKATGMDVQSLKEILTKTQTTKLWDELKAKGLDQYVKGNYKARITRLEQLQAQIYAKAKEIYTLEEKQHTACHSDVLNDSYYKTIYDTQIGTGWDFPFSTLDDNLVESVLSERWSGKNYSKKALNKALGLNYDDRIWNNTDLLAESLSEIVGGAVLSGQSYAKTSRQIRERFNVAKYYADRLVRTECNYFHNQADAMAYKEMGVEKYVFIAVLDTRTSTICQNLDNDVIDLDKKQVGVNYPPMHPNCRSTTRAYLGEEIEKTLKRRARNPITGENEVIDNISYREWAEQHGLNKEKQTQNVAISQKKKRLSEGMFDTYNFTKADSIRPRSVTNELKKSKIGAEILKYIEEEKVPIRLCYGAENPNNDLGIYDPFDDVIVIHCDKTKTIEETALTVIHEVKHRQLGSQNTFAEEVECYKTEYLHKKSELTKNDIDSIIKHVREIYPNLK